MANCNLRHVKQTSDCIENPAGLSSFMYVVPLDTNHIATKEDGSLDITVDDDNNEYKITVPTANAGVLKGWRVDFKSNTGQVSSEHNGEGTGWTHTGTWRVDKNENDMAVMGRRLSNMGGGYLCFFPTGITHPTKGKEWKVVGNPDGDIQYSSGNDSGQNRTDDHGTTPQVVCNFQVYDTVKWYGAIADDGATTQSGQNGG